MNTGIASAWKQIVSNLNAPITALPRPKDRNIGRIVDLPEDWYVLTNFQAEWAQDVKEARYEGRVKTLDARNNLVPTDKIALRLIIDGEVSDNKIELDQWVLSLAQKDCL